MSLLIRSRGAVTPGGEYMNECPCGGASPQPTAPQPMLLAIDLPLHLPPCLAQHLVQNLGLLGIEWGVGVGDLVHQGHHAAVGLCVGHRLVPEATDARLPLCEDGMPRGA